MNYFLTYIDILGFARKLEGETNKSDPTTEEIRFVWRNRVKDKLKNIKDKNFILHIQEMSPDSWILFADTIENVLRSINELIKSELPLEVAVGFKKYPYSPAPAELIYLRDKTMTYLKDDILGPYKHWYKIKNKDSIKQTFILLTTEAYEMIDDKNLCCIPYKSAGFYLVKREEFEKKLTILEFLEKIGSQRAEYKKIEELYVEPKNYGNIKNTLKQHNIVFIIGDAEMGKTYTAIRLLWEYSKEYEPVYIPEERRIEQWEFLRHKTEFEGKAIYLEDPWGKVEFERVESLFRDIGTFIEEARRKNCKIIITSREKIFKEFEKRKETAENLWKFVNLLKVNLAYSDENLTEVLNKYIQVFKPAWSNNGKLRKIAVEAVGENLRTPMSIKKLMDFSKDITAIKDFNGAIGEASIETKIAFAREIKEMFNRGDYDNIAFLSFPYIGVKREVAKSCYAIVLKDFNYDMKGRSFEDLIKEFSEVEISNSNLRFIHPSYSDAFGFALTDNGKPNNICKNIFSHVLLNLSEKIDSSCDVAWAVTRNFDKLPEDVRNKLLIRLSEKSNPIRDGIYSPSFEKEKISTLDVISRVVANNFDKLPENVRNELLLKLSEKENAPIYVAWTIANNFDKLPKDIRKLLFTFLERIQSAQKWKESWVLDRNISKSWPIEEIEARARAEEARAVAWAVENNFDKLPKNVRNELLHQLSNKKETSEYVARTIVNNFVKVPEKIRNDVLILLSRDHDTAKDVQDAFKFSYYKLPTDIRNILNLNLGLGGIVLDGFESNDKSLNFLKRIKLLELLNHNWDYNPNEIKFADMKDILHG